MKTLPLVAIAVGLTGCFGDDVTWPRLDPGEVRELTGLSAPRETAEDQTERADDIFRRADSLIISTAYGETSDPEVPEYQVHTSCEGTRCRWFSRELDFDHEIVIPDDLEVVEGTTQTLGTRNGITLTSEYSESEEDTWAGLGAWMDHSSFTVQSNRYLGDDGTSYRIRHGIVIGDLSGSRPADTATWLGIMVGTPATGPRLDNRLVGTAMLTYDLATTSLDAAFTDIIDLDRSVAHSTLTLDFHDVPVSASGAFAAGAVGNFIQGAFYGPGHVEAAGVFEQSNIVGAFGARQW